jgi:hypothetical protein
MAGRRPTQLSATIFTRAAADGKTLLGKFAKWLRI